MHKLKNWFNRKRLKNLPQPAFRHPSEQWAAIWLQEHGLHLVKHNYQIRGGEIDLIMQDDKTLVFVEVRYRQHSQHGFAADTINRRKQQKLLRAAHHYLQQTGTIDRACRFDVICLDQARDGSVSYQWYRNAFGESGFY